MRPRGRAVAPVGGYGAVSAPMRRVGGVLVGVYYLSVDYFERFVVRGQGAWFGCEPATGSRLLAVDCCDTAKSLQQFLIRFGWARGRKLKCLLSRDARAVECIANRGQFHMLGL
ncbi:hypothetical protein BST38_14830 [Mycolicibacterium parafortuitum]|nr:hypothetical protein BST38_14830 [Mycolicibacterium parafortuitum]